MKIYSNFVIRVEQSNVLVFLVNKTPRAFTFTSHFPTERARVGFLHLTRQIGDGELTATNLEPRSSSPDHYRFWVETILHRRFGRVPPRRDRKSLRHSRWTSHQKGSIFFDFKLYPFANLVLILSWVNTHFEFWGLGLSGIGCIGAELVVF